MIARRLVWLLWRVRRWNRRQGCIASHHHSPEDQAVGGVPTARVFWCRTCSSVEWID